MKKLVIFAAILILAAVVFYRVGSIDKDAQVVERLPVRVDVAEVRRGTIRDYVFGEGTARALQREYLAFEKSGKVVYIGDDGQGQPLREGSAVRGPVQGERLGQLLARIDRRDDQQGYVISEANLAKARADVNAAEADVDSANVDVRYAGVDLDRAEKLLGQGVISEQEVEAKRTAYAASEARLQTARARLRQAQSQVKAVAAELNKAKVGLERTSLFAPFDGVVTFLNIEEGDLVTPPSLAAMDDADKAKSAHVVVIDPSSMEVTVELLPMDARRVKPGQVAYLYRSVDELVENMETAGGVPATVYSVTPALTPGGRTVQVKLRTDEASGLTDGQFVTAWIVADKKTDALLTPLDSLFFRSGKPFMYVVGKDSTVSLRELKLGIEAVRRHEILGGVAEGDRVVTRGKHVLADGMAVSVGGGDVQ